MKKLIPILFSLIALVGCEEISGTLQINSPLTIFNKDGRAILLPVGLRQAKIEVKDDGRELELKFKDVAGKDQKAKLKAAGGLNLPTSSGSFMILGNQVGQPWNLNGQVQTNRSEGNRERSFESCTTFVIEYQCSDYPVRGRDGRIHYERRCQNVSVARLGTKEVQYRNIMTTTSAMGQFTEPSNRLVLATFSGSRTDNQKHIDFEGPCFSGYGDPHRVGPRPPRRRW